MLYYTIWSKWFFNTDVRSLNLINEFCWNVQRMNMFENISGRKECCEEKLFYGIGFLRYVSRKNFKVIKFFYKGKTIFNMHECDPHSNEFNDHGRLKSIEATMKDKAMVSF